jgi:hypothetical protein
MPRINVGKPVGTKQECTFCDKNATVTVEMDPKQRHAYQIFFHLCKSHADDLIRELAPYARDDELCEGKWEVVFRLPWDE